MNNGGISAIQQQDLLDLELSHEPNDDVDKPVSNDDGMALFNYDDVTEPMLGNNIDNTNDSKIDNNSSSTNINIGSIGNNDNNNNDKTANGNNIDPSNAKCWNIEYYQTYFDLDTSDELMRLKKALLPFMAGQFFDKDLDEKPDLLSDG